MDELIDALNFIKEECEKHTECRSCSMYDIKYSECGLFKPKPRDWEIRDSVKIIYSVIGGY